ncbi:MAG: encapsulin [Gammaproteobacteria bacterium]
MDLRQNRLPWSEQIWAKINADLAQALTQARRVRTPFEVVSVPDSTQTVLSDGRDAFDGLRYTETDSLPVIELSVPIQISQSQAFNEGDNFYALDRIIEAAHTLGVLEDSLLVNANAAALGQYGLQFNITNARAIWPGLYYPTATTPRDLPHILWPTTPSTGKSLFDAVNDARISLRQMRRYEPYALFVSHELEGELYSTVWGSNSLNTPLERMRPLVTAGIHSTPVLARDTAIVVATSRAWIDIAQAMEPSIQFLAVDDNGDYKLRLVERFAFRLKDTAARIVIRMS